VANFISAAHPDARDLRFSPQNPPWLKVLEKFLPVHQ
jgi:hypothetical protein